MSDAETDSKQPAVIGILKLVSKVLAALLLVLWILAIVSLVSDYEQTPMYKFSKIDQLNAPYLAFMRAYYGVNAESPVRKR